MTMAQGVSASAVVFDYMLPDMTGGEVADPARGESRTRFRSDVS